MRYGRTHMWFGAHMLVLLILAVALGLKASLLVAWANILAILSLLAAPFWFNPFSLDWQNNKVSAWLSTVGYCAIGWECKTMTAATHTLVAIACMHQYKGAAVSHAQGWPAP